MTVLSSFGDRLVMVGCTVRTNVRRAEMNLNRTLVTFCVTVALAACSAQPPAASAVSPAVSLSAASPTASPVPSGWPTGDPAPPELAGRWYQASGAIIVFSGHDYMFPGAGGGNLVVNGNEITFFNGFTAHASMALGRGRSPNSASQVLEPRGVRRPHQGL